ncbi:diguanylate cyclase [Acidaminobacter sp. JC074]|uniref:diguanylate cyclase domain-containing protein n=1 Tax=Acidaminobacter sp. JC074 TaxID=2530199 RepID=UPI001F0EAAA1|nr:diguanylate cyclase [Acidaminobacter sp. JC074]MCH4889774.1 diguanylate cyclase [Acidaminobacter sp. JC074]
MKKKNKLELEIERLNKEVALLKRMNMKKEYLIQNLEHRLSLNKTTDLLTEAYTKQHLVKKYREAINMKKRWHFDISLCLFDIRFMSSVNETYGADFGDSLIKSFSKLSKHLIRDELDSFFRIEGDKFFLILVDCNHENGQKICKRIENEFYHATDGHKLSYEVFEVSDLYDNSIDDYLKMMLKKIQYKKRIN